MMSQPKRAAPLAGLLAGMALLAGPASTAARTAEPGLLHKARYQQTCLSVLQSAVNSANRHNSKIENADNADTAAYWIGMRCGIFKQARNQMADMGCEGEEMDEADRYYEEEQTVLERSNELAEEEFYSCSLTP